MKLPLPDIDAIESEHPRPQRASVRQVDELVGRRLTAWYADIRDRAGLDDYPGVQNVRVNEEEDRRLRKWLESLYKGKSQRWLSRHLGMFWLDLSPMIDDDVPSGKCELKLPGDDEYREPPRR